jgi:hypothetical protein
MWTATDHGMGEQHPVVGLFFVHFCSFLKIAQDTWLMMIKIKSRSRYLKGTKATSVNGIRKNKNKNMETERPVVNKLSRELSRLNIDMTAGPRKVQPVTIKMDAQEVQMAIEYVYSTLLASDPGTPRTYKDAMKSVNVEYWIDGIKVEFGNFDKRQVHRTMNRKKLKRTDKVLKCRRVFKKKIKEGRWNNSLQGKVSCERV